MGSDYHFTAEADRYDALNKRLAESLVNNNKLLVRLIELQDKYDKLEALYKMKVVDYG